MAGNNTTTQGGTVVNIDEYTGPSGLVFTRTSDHTTNAGYYKHSLQLRDAAALYNGEFSVWKSDIPQTNNEMLDIMEFAKDCEVAFETPTEVIYVKVDGAEGWLAAFTELGFELFNSDKLLKRFKVWRQTPFNVKLKRCNVLEIDCTYFMGDRKDELIAKFGLEKCERVLDGGIFAREHIRTQALKKMDEESSLPDDDPIRAQAIAQRLTEAPMWNVRYTGVGKSGTHQKGNQAFGPDEYFDRVWGKKVDLIVVKKSGKKEVLFQQKDQQDQKRHGCYFQAEPQMAKYEVRMNNQTKINVWPLFTNADEQGWIRDYLVQNWKRIQRGEALEGAVNILNAEAALIKDGHYQDLLVIGERWNALEALASGLDITTMPDLLNTVFSTVTKRIWNPKTQAAHPIVPCAWHFQMVSNSFARMCGWNHEVADNTCRVVTEMGWFVISDHDFILNYENFGGNDMDDFFDGYFRTIDDVKKIVLVRSPNSIGEYGIFDFVEGDPYPEWTRYNDEVISFPKVAGKGWPKQLTKALEDGTVDYTGLPSTLKPSEEKKEQSNYTYSDFITKLALRIGDKSNVGRVVNVEMIYTATFHKHVPVQLCSHEDKVDTFINNGPMEDRAALAAEAVERAVVLATSGKGVDKWLWENKNMDKLLPEGVERPELVDGPISRLIREVRNAVHEYMAEPHTVTDCESCLSLKREVGSQFLGGKVYRYGQQNAKLPTEKTRELGAWFLGDYGGDQFRAYDGWGALRILRDFRAELGRTMRANEEHLNQQINAMAEMGLWMSDAEIQAMRVMSPEQWKRIYLKVEADMWRLVNRATDTKPGGDGRQLAIHDVVLAVARAAYDSPTFTKQQVKENILTNKVIWPYYLEALRFYGQANDVLGEYVESWDLECVHCHRVLTANDPVGRQAFTRFDGMCKTCRGLGEWTVTCVVTRESRTLNKLGNVQLFYREGSISKAGWGLLAGRAILFGLNI